ncbi:uncharacterized protein LOC143034292 [Oratosquilla oratoria]|uniref:uncharacterized protein LOC143034292 n=1 Tax=Oratosquilla oratoria TaxID=337810 RepID=UPI003F770C3A
MVWRREGTRRTWRGCGGDCNDTEWAVGGPFIFVRQGFRQFASLGSMTSLGVILWPQIMSAYSMRPMMEDRLEAGPKDANCLKPRLAHIKGSPTAYSVSLQSPPHSLQVLLVPSRRHTLFDMKLTLICLALATVFASSWGLPSPDPEASFGYGSPYGGHSHGGLVGTTVFRPVVQPIVRPVVPVVHRVVSPVSHGVSHGGGYGRVW